MKNAIHVPASVRVSLVLTLALVLRAPAARAADGEMNPADCPMHKAHIAARGDAAMGFEHTRTTHHFVLLEDGGLIEAEAMDASDTASRDRIRAHFVDIAARFARGDFAIPEQIHGRVPPGVPTLRKKRAKITYRAEESERGGRVRITTADTRALRAVHEFLRFQIEDHATGDPLEVRGITAAAPPRG